MSDEDGNIYDDPDIWLKVLCDFVTDLVDACEDIHEDPAVETRG